MKKKRLLSMLLAASILLGLMGSVSAAQPQSSGAGAQAEAEEAQVIAAQAEEGALPPQADDADDAPEEEDISPPEADADEGTAELAEITLSGSGTEEDPYLISTESDLAQIESAPKGYFSVQKNISLTSDSQSPICASTAFTGTLDGNGHTISGISITDTSSSYAGLIGQNKGTIKNLKVSGIVTAAKSAGLLAGFNSGTVENCSASGTVSSSGSSSSGCTGGLVGHNNKGSIKHCTSAGTVSNTSSGLTGGLVGWNESGVIQYSGSTANVSSSKGYVGGLVGESKYSSTINNCYAQGKVSGEGTGGGLVGYMYRYSSSYSDVIRNSYASGKVMDGAGGGLVGSNSGASVYNSYYRSANGGNNVGIAVTLTAMASQSTFWFWDFDNVWTMENELPVLIPMGEEKTVTFSGDGDEDSPYLIRTEEQLYALAMNNMPANNAQAHYKLATDIQITALCWIPIGLFEPFLGTFDGGGHTVSGVNVSGTYYTCLGFFGQNKGTIKNLNVSGSMSGDAEAALLVSYNTGTIENCSVSGSVSSTGSGTSACTGGLVGHNEKGTVINCTSSGAVTNTSSGITGGLVGWNESGVIKYSGSTTNVSSSKGYAGGLVGESKYTCTIENCYAQGKVTGEGTVGGLVGYMYRYSSSYTDVIRNCYASGKVNSGSGAGLVGSNSNGWIYNSYYNSANSGSNVGFGVSTTQMGSESTFWYWDFGNIWTMKDGLPVVDLRGEEKVITFAGDGDEDSPYLIRTEEQLYALAMNKMPANNSLAYYKLACDIEVTALYWTPIGLYVPFLATFDGDGHTVSGLNTSGTFFTCLGFIGQNKGTIKNLNVSGSMSGVAEAALLVSYNTGTVENCSADGSVYSTGSGTDACTGGLVGHNEKGTVINCTSSGSVSNTSSGITGGLVGWNESGVIKYSGSTANVSSAKGYVGGLVGESKYTSTIENCYAQGRVIGDGTAGGLVGYMYRYSSNYTDVIRNCYASGKVNTGSGAGLVGNNSNGWIYNSYYNSANSGNTVGFAVTPTTMGSADTFYFWDFINIWTMKDGLPVIDIRGEEKEITFRGDGLDDDPYLVETEEQLYALSMNKMPSNTVQAYYKLTSDIAITALYWSPIGLYVPFQATFDGDGHTVSGVNTSGTFFTCLGFFGQNKGSVKNLKVSGSMSGVGEAALLVSYNTGAIENCSVSGTVSSTGGGTDGCTGGLAGHNEKGTIANCSSSASVTNTSNGITGGLVGWNESGRITCCFSTGEVSGQKGNVGGLVGESKYTSTISDCYSRANVSGTGTIGGLVGYLYRYSSSYTDTVQNCYAAGEFNTTSTKRGGLVGNNASGTVTSAYYDTDVTGQTDSDRGAPVSTAEMKTQSTYVDWDFDETWAISSSINGGYPYLRSNSPGGDEYHLAVSGVSLDKTSLSLTVGDTATLTATVSPDIATDKTVTWKSSNESVAAVNNGTVTAVGEGSATITVTTVDGGKTASCSVKVAPGSVTVPVEDIKVFKDDDHVITDISSVAGRTRSGLTAVVYPENAADKTVVWSSSNPSAVTVSQTGELTFKSAGTAVITVSTPDGSVSTSFTAETRAMPELKLITSKTSLSLAVGESETISAYIEPGSITPERGSGYSFSTSEPFTWTSLLRYVPESWNSSDGSIIGLGISLESCTVTALSPGSTYINVTYNDGKNLLRIPVTVYNYTPTGAYRIVSGSYTWEEARDACIAMGGHLATITSAGEQAYIQQLNSSDRQLWIGGYRDDSFNWYWVTGESWNYTNWCEGEPNNDGNRGEKYAAVWPQYWNDLVLASNEQSGFICEWDDGIVVPASVTVDPSSVELTVGQTAGLKATVSPADATDKTVTWKSSDDSVATVDSGGTVTAVSKGSATITCTTRSGGKTAECTVNVNSVSASSIKLNTTYKTFEHKDAAYLLKATVSPAGTPVTWTSTDENVATVTQDGLVRATGVGSAYITAATPDGAQATCFIKVTSDTVLKWWLIDLYPSSLTMMEGASSTLVATILYKDTQYSAYGSVIWLSSDPSVATVSNGSVTAIKAGTATISAIFEDNGKTATCKVTVKAAAATLSGIELSGPSATQIIQGTSLDLSDLVVTAVYSDGTRAEVTGYTISGCDTSKLGAQTVTVTYQGKTAAFGITVVARSVTGITITSRPSKLSYAWGEALDTSGLAVSAVYNDGSSEAVTGYTVSGFSATTPGSQTVTVSYQGFTAAFTVTVAQAPVTGDLSKPVFSIESFLGGKKVTLSSSEGAAIYYTLDGSAPTSASSRYTSPLVFTVTATLKAVAIQNGVSSKVTTARITVSQAEKPVIVPAGGLVEKGSIVTLRSDTVGAAMYYTTDGSAPSPNSGTSIKYNGAIFVQGDMILKAVAVKDGYTSSDVASAKFTVPQPPADEATIALGSVTVPAGNTASLPIYIFSDSDITGFRISVSFDKNLFDSSVTVTPAEGVDASELFSAANGGSVNIMYTGSTLESGEICTLNLTTLATVPAGSVCSVEVMPERSSVTLAGIEKVELSAMNGAVTVTETQLTSDAVLTDHGNGSYEASVSIYNDSSDGSSQVFANLYLGVYDRSGRMISVNTWRVDVSDPMFLFTQTINIPQGKEAGSVKIMLLSDEMTPLMPASVMQS